MNKIQENFVLFAFVIFTRVYIDCGGNCLKEVEFSVNTEDVSSIEKRQLLEQPVTLIRFKNAIIPQKFERNLDYIDVKEDFNTVVNLLSA